MKRGDEVAPVKRAAFVIDTDRKVLDVLDVLDVLGSEFNVTSHADKALEVLRSQ